MQCVTSLLLDSRARGEFLWPVLLAPVTSVHWVGTGLWTGGLHTSLMAGAHEPSSRDT